MLAGERPGRQGQLRSEQEVLSGGAGPMLTDGVPDNTADVGWRVKERRAAAL